MVSQNTIGSQWLIEDWFPKGHEVMDTNTEGGFKTITGCFVAVCVASGNDFLGKKVQQGPVLMVDEETPKADLEKHLNRFAQGFGYSSYANLPITVRHMKGFRFGQKTGLDDLLKVIEKETPVFIRIDSVVACLPSGRQGMGENNAEAGEAIRDDLNRILRVVPDCTIMIAAHSKKEVRGFGLSKLKHSTIEELVRGHGSIVGQACDTGLILKKISERPEPSRYVILTRARRRAIPMAGEEVYVEMEEETYGEGWARLKQIAPVALPPSKLASNLYPLFKSQPITASEIVKTAAFYSKGECEIGVEELQERKVIVQVKDKPFTYKLNPSLLLQADKNYLAALNGTAADDGKLTKGVGKREEKKDGILTYSPHA